MLYAIRHNQAKYDCECPGALQPIVSMAECSKVHHAETQMKTDSTLAALVVVTVLAAGW